MVLNTHASFMLYRMLLHQKTYNEMPVNFDRQYIIDGAWKKKLTKHVVREIGNKQINHRQQYI